MTPPIPAEREKILTRIRRLRSLGQNQKGKPEGKSSMKEARRLMKLHHVREEDLETGVNLQDEAFRKKSARRTFEVFAAMMNLAPTWNGYTAHFEEADPATCTRIHAAFGEAWPWLEPKVDALLRTERHKAPIVWDSVYAGLVEQASALGMKPVEAPSPPATDTPIAGTLSGPTESAKALPGPSDPPSPAPSPDPTTASSSGADIGSFSVSGYVLGVECPGVETLFPNRIETLVEPTPIPTPTPASRAPSTPPPPASGFRTWAHPPPRPPQEDRYTLEIEYATFGSFGGGFARPHVFGPGPLLEVNNQAVDAMGQRTLRQWTLRKNDLYLAGGYEVRTLNQTIARLLPASTPPAPPKSTELYTLEVLRHAMDTRITLGPAPLLQVSYDAAPCLQGSSIWEWWLKKNGQVVGHGTDAYSLNQAITGLLPSLQPERTSGVRTHDTPFGRDPFGPFSPFRR